LSTIGADHAASGGDDDRAGSWSRTAATGTDTSGEADGEATGKHEAGDDHEISFEAATLRLRKGSQIT
jgi:hypothetical protein